MGQLYQKGYSYSQTQRSSSDSRNNKNNYFSSSSSYNSVVLLKELKGLAHMAVAWPIPTPGQLLVSTFTNRGQKAPFPAFQVFQRRPPFPTVKVPR
nr:hypothetical protein BaRGS_010066 [Batillaria attramentaria]